MFWIQLTTIATAHLLAVMSPGPDFAIIVKNSLSYSKKTAIYTAFGVALGIAIHVALAIFGIAVLLQTYDWLFMVVKWAGAGYLFYIGIMAVQAKKNKFIDEGIKFEIKEDLPPLESIKIGFLTNALNPKAALFFLGLFTQVVEPGTSIFHQLIFGGEMILATFLWFATLGIIISNKKIKSFMGDYIHWVDRVMGVVLMALAVWVVVG